MSHLLWNKRFCLGVLVACVAGTLTAEAAAPRRAKTAVVSKPVSSATPQKKAALLLELPDYCNTPDGMTVLPDGSIILSVPNYNDKSAPPVLVKITKDNKAELFLKLPPHPDTGRIGPMGIRVAPSGDLYLADNQLFHHPDGKSMLYGKSRLLRIPVKDGKPGEPVVVASNLNVANGVDIHDGYVYVTETILVPDSKPLISGIYRFKLGEEGVVMKSPLTEDPHLIATMKTFHKSIPFGADGIAFDSKGAMFVGNFADGTMHKITLDKDGKVLSNAIFAKAPFLKSCDGMVCDQRTDKLYVADLAGNAVRIISPDGSVQTLAESPDGDGADGGLESPCEAMLRGDEIIVSNMDFPVEGGVNTKPEKPYTLSIIKLDPPKAKPAKK
jgi:sugar lactone lactonase YvrE